MKAQLEIEWPKDTRIVSGQSFTGRLIFSSSSEISALELLNAQKSSSKNPAGELSFYSYFYLSHVFPVQNSNAESGESLFEVEGILKKGIAQSEVQLRIGEQNFVVDIPSKRFEEFAQIESKQFEILPGPKREYQEPLPLWILAFCIVFVAASGIFFLRWRKHQRLKKQSAKAREQRIQFFKEQLRVESKDRTMYDIVYKTRKEWSELFATGKKKQKEIESLLQQTLFQKKLNLEDWKKLHQARGLYRKIVEQGHGV